MAWPQSHRLRAADVLDERIRLESISTAIGASGVMVIAFIMYLIFPRDLPQASYLGYWLVTQLLAGFTWLGFIAYYHHYRHPQTRRWWPYLSTLICSFYGFIWGAGWVFFVGDTDIVHAQAAVVFTIILGGVFTGGVLATIFHLPSLTSFMLCSLLPPLISTFVNHGIFHQWFGVSLVVYMLACTLFALNLHFFLMDTLQQREEKASLAQQLQEEKLKAEQASQDKTRFLAAASHDLRQPLQALNLYQGSLAAVIQQGNTVEQQRILDNMKASIASLTDLLNAMLDISQLETGHFSLQRQVFPLNDLLHRIYQQYESLAAEADIALHYATTSLYVESDPTQLERILRNLVENAIKHMGKHTGRYGRILLGTRRKGQTLRIEVWDNGVGIAESEQQAIFREFYQLHNPERKRERGIGLGLAIIKRTAIALGHRLELRSQPNQGSMFAITVPRATPLCPTYSPLHSTESQPQPTLQGKILIIEDDTAVAESLSTLLTLWGYHTITSSLPNPEQLIAQHPDIRFIISDYQLAAGVDGISVIQHLRQVARNDIPALLITGNTSPALAQQLQQLNIPVSYKPINPLNLKLLIN